MSLRLRLVLLTVALVTLVALALSALYLENLVGSLTTEAIDRSDFAGQQINTFLIDHINQHSGEYEPPKSVEETRTLWNRIAASDIHISNTLQKVMAASRSIIEINVAGQDGMILVSSNPLRENLPIKRLQPITEINQGNAYQRFKNLVSRRPDYEATIPIGIEGDALPVFTIQLVTSNVLLRASLLPRLNRLAFIAGAGILGSLLLTVLATAGALRPIRRIEQTIDRIAAGSFRTEESRTPDGTRAAKEFRVMESKLNLLGQQMRGARQDASQLRHNVDQLLDRVATELDVATRVTAISRLTGGVAHEIKNPLNAIVLRLDLLRERLGDPEEELRAEIDILSKEALRLDRVVKTFLDFSRPVDVKLEELDLGALAKEVADLVRPQAKVAHTTLEFEAPAEPALIRGDADMLKQAVLNLVTNGLEAMKSGGCLKLSVSTNEGHVRLSVADTGPGIPEELRAKVFQLYFTTKTKGSGIGLALTYRAVQMHNGTIEFHSEAGSGTTFLMEFPALVRAA